MSERTWITLTSRNGGELFIRLDQLLCIDEGWEDEERRCVISCVQTAYQGAPLAVRGSTSEVMLSIAEQVK